jgi:hypothetical protein
MFCSRGSNSPRPECKSEWSVPVCLEISLNHDCEHQGLTFHLNPIVYQKNIGIERKPVRGSFGHEVVLLWACYATEEARNRLELLKYAYIGARYDMHYWIARRELQLLEPCVERLLERTEKICKEKIERLCSDL